MITQRNFKFSHIGIAVSNIAKAVSEYQKIFGYNVLSGPFDDPIQKVSVCFLGSGDTCDLIIELVSPTGGDSPVNKVLEKGIGAYHICYEVEDIEKKLLEIRAAGCIVLSKPISATAFEGRQIAWFYTPSHQLVEILEKRH